MSKIKKSNQILAGFALETEDLLKNGQSKLERKKLDFIVLNQSSESNPAFGTNSNQISILDQDGTVQNYPKLEKFEIAAIISEKLLQKFNSLVQDE
jgi:phosphopantothenoylcysteine decarboxylase/phosphopantothenate--cysteine ligase